MPVTERKANSPEKESDEETKAENTSMEAEDRRSLEMSHQLEFQILASNAVSMDPKAPQEQLMLEKTATNVSVDQKPDSVDETVKSSIWLQMVRLEK